MKAFICYSHSPSDSEFARWLFHELKRKRKPVGIEPLMDRESLAVGTLWPDSIPVVLGTCQMVLFVRSRFAVNAIMCRRELDYAADKGLEIVNLRIDADTTSFERTVAYMTLDFSNGRAEGMRALAKGMQFRATPLGRLQILRHRLTHHRDKLRDPSRPDRSYREQQVARIEQEITALEAQSADGEMDGGALEPAPEPPVDDLILDRKPVIAELHDVLSSGRPGIVLVTGPEGIGKTAVVRKAIASWASEAGADGEMTTFIYHLVQPGTVLGAGIFTEEQPDKSDANPLMDIEEAIDSVVNRRLVVVLDSAENLASPSGAGFMDPQLEDLLERLGRRPGHRIVIILVSRDVLTGTTARTWPGRARHISITEGLNVPDFTRLLRHLDQQAEFAPASASEQLLAEARSAMGGIPRTAELAVTWAATNYYTLEDVVEELRRLKPAQVGAFVFEKAFLSLDDTARTVIEAVAAFGLPIDEPGVADLLPNHTRRRIEVVLRSLVHRGLVNTAAGLFYLRATDRDRVLRAMDGQCRTVMLGKAGDVIRRHQPENGPSTLNHARLYLAEANIRIAAGEYPEAFAAVSEVHEFLSGLNRSELLLNSREKLRGHLEPENEFYNRNQLGAIYMRLGRPDEAQAAFLEARALAEKLGNLPMVLQMDMNLGTVAFDAYRTDEAVSLFERAGAVGFRPGRSKPQEWLARCRHRRGDLEGAFQLLQEAMDANPEQQHQRAADLQLLQARWLVDAGRPDEAERLLMEVGTGECAQRHPQIYARFLIRRADLLVGRYSDEALVSVDRAIREALAVGDPVIVEEARAARAFVDLAHADARKRNPHRALREITLADRVRPRGRSLLTLALRASAELALHDTTAGSSLARLREEAGERAERDDCDWAAHQMLGFAIAGLHLCDGTPIEPALDAINHANDVPAPPGQRARFALVLHLLVDNYSAPSGDDPDPMASVIRAAT